MHHSILLGCLCGVILHRILLSMVKTTLIARVADGLPLAASMDDEETADLIEYKTQAKMLFKRLSAPGQNDQRCSLDSPPYVFQ